MEELQHIRSIGSIEIAIEDTENEIKRVAEFLIFVADSKINSDLKTEFSNRLKSELNFLYSIKEEQEESKEYHEGRLNAIIEDITLEEELEKRHNANNQQDGIL